MYPNHSVTRSQRSVLYTPPPVPIGIRSGNLESTEFRGIPIGILVNSEIPSKFLGMSNRNSSEVNSEYSQVKFRVNS
jgi:hypothetical protein